MSLYYAILFHTILQYTVAIFFCIVIVPVANLFALACGGEGTDYVFFFSFSPTWCVQFFTMTWQFCTTITSRILVRSAWNVHPMKDQIYSFLWLLVRTTTLIVVSFDKNTYGFGPKNVRKCNRNKTRWLRKLRRLRLRRELLQKKIKRRPWFLARCISPPK